MRASASLLAIFVTASPAFATSFAAPERRDVFSPNRAFVLDVNPDTQTHTVYDARDRDTLLWSFSAPVWQAPFLLSNDGQVVVTFAWRHVKAEDLAGTPGIVFRNRQGVFRQYPVADLCQDPPKTEDWGVGPIGEFWRTWYDDVLQDDETVTVRTTRGVAWRFRTSDGELIEGRPVGAGRNRWLMWLLAAVIAGLMLFLALRRRGARTKSPS